MNFRKLFFVCITLLIFCGNIIGGTVDNSTARLVATNWYRHYAPLNKQQGSISKTVEYKYKDATNFYIFSFDKGGFVIVSANNSAEPVLGYGFEGGLSDSISNPAVRSMLDGYARQIDTLSVINLKSAYINPKWESIIKNVFLKSGGTNVEPLLKTKWDQPCYYNEMCPADAAGPCGHAFAGCTAVAMAQIMKFWNYPEKGIGQSDYIGKTIGSKYGRLSVFYNETKYDWAAMKDQLSAGNNAVATLLYHCGVSAKMDFGPTSSGAYLSNVASLGLVKYFDYASSIMYILKSDYDNEGWLTKLKSEIDSGRPILYEGYDSNRSLGHAFVCDGYQPNDFFHFNFGWSGSCDGYFNLVNITPSYTFTFFQGAIIGIKPNNSVLNAKFELKETPVNLQFQFIDYSTGAPSSWLWDFGDGITSTEHNPIHTYAAPGNYKITLTVLKNGNESKLTVDQNIQSYAFSNIQADLAGINGTKILFDYDNDGDLDLLINGWPKFVKLYNNNNGLFTEVNNGIREKGFSDQFEALQIEIGDYDNDGDMDILFLAKVNGLADVFIYQNNGGKFTEIDLKIPNVEKVKWIDCDGDGDLDILLTGMNRPRTHFAGKYIYENGKYFDASSNLPHRDGNYMSIEWVDFDNDGIMDLFFYGEDWESPNNPSYCKIYDFDDIGYKEINIDVPYFQAHTYNWGDYDGDGDLDLLFFGADTGQNGFIGVYQNDKNAFVNVYKKPYTKQEWSFISAQWIDYNLDGNLDIAFTETLTEIGKIGLPTKTAILLNDQGNFVDINANTDINYGKAKWFDYDNNGNLDVLDYNKVYKNEDGTFIKIFENSINYDASNTIGDFDNDKNLDFISSGGGATMNDFTTQIYKNNIGERKNSKPEIPSGLKAEVVNNDVTISWFPSSDDMTPQNLIKYNVFIGTKPDSADVLSPAADLNTGFQRVVNYSNAGYKKSKSIKNLANGTYYASVQAIDHVFSSSPFAKPIQFTVQGKNLEPCAYDVKKVTTINTVTTFSESDFTNSFSDPENEKLKKIKITSLPSEGILEFSGTPLSIDQEIFSNEINKLSYKTSRFSDDNFQWKGSDGTNFSSTIGLVQISVIIYKDINAGLKAMSNSISKKNSAAWGDYNNDGYMDFIMTGRSDSGSLSIPTIYKNISGGFIEMKGILPLDYADVAVWGDFDNDGDLDLAIAGENLMVPFTKIFRNDNGIFTDINAGLIGTRAGMLAWSDFDNDGDLDLTVSGIYNANNDRTTKIYRNDNGNFTDINAGLPGVNVGSISWGDYDNDGDLDLLLTGTFGTSTNIISKIFRNDNNKFTDINSNLDGFFAGNAEWGDYDNDGDVDILVSGNDSWGGRQSVIYRNDKGVFYRNSNNIPFSFSDNGGSAYWVDYDADGDLDLLVQGTNTANNPQTILYKNDNSSFSEKNSGIPDLINGSGSFGDYDNDGYQDFLLMGLDKDNIPFSGIFKNYFGSNVIKPNTSPTTPSNLSTLIQGNNVTFNWGKATDSQTPKEGLTYNLFVGSKVNSTDIVTPMSNLTTGYHQVMQIGNTGFKNSYNLKGLKTGTYYWSVQAIDNNYMGSTFAPVSSFIICDLPASAGIITGTATVCTGQNSVTYSIPTIANATMYFWTLPSGATGTSTTNSITVNYGASAVSGNISVKGNNSCGDGAISSLAITVNSSPANAGTITGTATVCQGQSSVNYSVPSIASATSCVWTLPAGATGTSTTNSITVNYGVSAVSGNITVKGNNPCGDGGVSTLAISVNPLPANVGTITGATTVCQGQNSTTYTVPLIANATSYIWTLPTGVTGTSTTNSIMVNYGSTAVSGNVTVKGNNPCGDGVVSTLAITVNPLPTNAGTITGATTVSQGQNSLTYTVPVIANATSYIWTLPTGATGTSTTNSIMVNYGATAVSGNVTVKGNNPCGDGVVSTLAITVNPLPANAGTITGATTVCQGQSSVNYSVPTISNATSCVWTLPAGATGTSTTNSITVNYGVSVVSGNISVKGINLCGDGGISTLAISVNPLPANAGTITGAVTVCQGQTTVNYSAPIIENATSYIWTLPSGATGTSMTNSITVNYGASAVSGNIAVKGNNPCGDGVVSTLAISVNPLPANAGTITGSTTVCQGQSSVNYSVPSIANATSYVWTLPSGATGTSTTNSITVNYGASAVSGNITVKGNNSCGDGGISAMAITVNSLPSVAGIISGMVTVCLGQSIESYTLPAVTNATSYVWTLPLGATGTSSTNSITVNYGITAVSGNIKVKGHNGCGDGAESTLGVTVTTGVIPTIKAKWGELLICSNLDNAITKYQWYKGSSAISNANAQYYSTGKLSGIYIVETTDKNGCKNISNAITITALSSLSVYPNPASVNFTLKLNDIPQGRAEVSLVNSKGIKVMQFQTEKLSDELLLKEIPVHNLPQGVYVIQVLMNHKDSYTTKIIIKK